MLAKEYVCWTRHCLVMSGWKNRQCCEKNNIQLCSKNMVNLGIPSGNLLHSYWKWPFIVDLPIEKWWFSIVMYSYVCLLEGKNTNPLQNLFEISPFMYHSVPQRQPPETATTATAFPRLDGRATCATSTFRLRIFSACSWPATGSPKSSNHGQVQAENRYIRQKKYTKPFENKHKFNRELPKSC